MAWPRALLVAAGSASALLVFRGLQLRSSIQSVYHGESASIGKLLRDLQTSSFHWDGPVEFVRDLTYFEFAQGTVLLQVVAAALTPLLGTSLWALHAAGITLEAAGVFAFALLVARMTRARLPAAAAILAFALVPRTIQSFHLVPYGNHSEFLWVPALLALWLHERAEKPPRWRDLWVPVAIVVVGLVCYRPSLAALGAAAVAWASLGGRTRLLGSAVLVLAVLGATGTILIGVLGLEPHTFVPYFHKLADAPTPGVSSWGHNLLYLLAQQLPVVDLGGRTGALHRIALLAGLVLGALAFLRRATPPVVVARYASTWAVASLLALAISGHMLPRYLIPSYYALVLCAATLAVAEGAAWRRAAASAVLLVTALGGLAEGLPLIDTDAWPHNRSFRGLELQWTLRLNHVELDELPYYRRLLDEGRGSEYVGAVSHDAMDGARCQDQVGLRSGPVTPDPSGDHCTGWEEGQLCSVLERCAPPRNVGDSEDDLTWAADVGRGAWIRANRSVGEVELGLAGCPGPWRTAAVEGALDEAAGWWTEASPP